METTMKVHSIRADVETLERFKAMAESFPNQSEALASLLATYETQNAKEALPGLATDVSDFDSHLRALQNAFLHILEVNQNTEERVRTEVQQLLASKDSQIIELQNRVKGLEQLVQTAQEQATAAETNADAIRQENEKLISSLKSKADAAEKRADEIAESAVTAKALVESLQKQLETTQEKIESASESEKKLDEIKKEFEESASEISRLKNQIETERQAAEQAKQLAAERAELAIQRAVAAEQQKAAEQAREQSEKAASQAKSAADEQKVLYATIAELKDEIHALKLEAVQAKSQRSKS